MTYSFKDGYREGVMFLFYDGDTRKILVEHRPTDSGEMETFIPNGSIEMKDHVEEKDYKTVALFREVQEEFAGKIIIKSYVPISEYSVDEVKLRFYIYLIKEWIGKIPDHTVEDGKKHADLEWISLEKFRTQLKFESAIHACEKLQEYLKNN